METEEQIKEMLYKAYLQEQDKKLMQEIRFGLDCNAGDFMEDIICHFLERNLQEIKKKGLMNFVREIDPDDAGVYFLNLLMYYVSKLEIK